MLEAKHPETKVRLDSVRRIHLLGKKDNIKCRAKFQPIPEMEPITFDYSIIFQMMNDLRIITSIVTEME